jgi:hypothetical protein
MTRKRLLGVVVLILFSSFPLILKHASGKPVDKSPDLSSLSDEDLKGLMIRLERTQCYGSCPAYTITIHGDGRVEYRGKEHVKVKELRNSRVDTAAIKVLAWQFAQTNFLSLPEEDYSEAKCKCRHCTDFPSVVVEITVGAMSHRVNQYYGCACPPKALFELESAIDRTANSEQWTGDTSKQGPYGTTCFG